jgi:hypothetical protein
MFFAKHKEPQADLKHGVYRMLTKVRSNEALLFPKKLVFSVGKKALANRQALLQFLVACWLVRIANVLGGERRLILYNVIFKKSIINIYQQSSVKKTIKFFA